MNSVGCCDAARSHSLVLKTTCLGQKQAWNTAFSGYGNRPLLMQSLTTRQMLHFWNIWCSGGWYDLRAGYSLCVPVVYRCNDTRFRLGSLVSCRAYKLLVSCRNFWFYIVYFLFWFYIVLQLLVLFHWRCMYVWYVLLNFTYLLTYYCLVVGATRWNRNVTPNKLCSLH